MFPVSKGKVAKQAHVGIPAGTYEEEHGREAFAGRASHLYRTHPPTAWVAIEGPLRPRALDLNKAIPADQSDPRGGWLPILMGRTCRIWVSLSPLSDSATSSSIFCSAEALSRW